MSLDRRSLLQASLAAGAAFGAVPLLGSKRDDKYKTALVGGGWWGRNIARVALASGECRVTAVCDVDQKQRDAAAEEIERLAGAKPPSYPDFRELLEREKPEIVIVATPDHWHPLITIAAIGAGAHVYVEKPVGHTIGEGQAMVKAARAADRVVQVGMHRRVSPHNQSAIRFLREGRAGTIGMVRAFVHSGGGPGEPTPDEAPPAHLDWNFWCGPAPLRPFNRRLHPKGFRQYLDYANGQLGDWGTHWLDQILWWTEEKAPRTVYSTGDQHIKRDKTDVPDTQVATWEFETFTAVWEHRLYAGNAAEKHSLGCYFYGTGGTLHLGWQDGWTFYPTRKGEPVRHEPAQLDAPDGQNIRALWANFLECIRTNKRPVCDIEVGHRATNLALLGMLSLKLGRSVRWDGDKETIVGDAQANALLCRPYRAPWKYPTI